MVLCYIFAGLAMSRLRLHICGTFNQLAMKEAGQ
jgi:hypothetical protein